MAEGIDRWHPLKERVKVRLWCDDHVVVGVKLSRGYCRAVGVGEVHGWEENKKSNKIDSLGDH